LKNFYLAAAFATQGPADSDKYKSRQQMYLQKRILEANIYNMQAEK
jgi:hypothetical protein